MPKKKRSLEDVEPLNKNYKYILDDDGKWHRIGADDITRTFESLVVTPKGNKYKHVPNVDNSEEGIKFIDKISSRPKPYVREGFVGEPGLELIHPEFDLLSLSPIVKKGINYASNKILDNFIFVKKPNSFTRGIGDTQGFNDLLESGLVRGNPVGTEVLTPEFTKMYRHNREHFKDIMEDTGIKGIAQKFFNRSLTEKEFNAIKNAAKSYYKNDKSKPTKNTRFSLEEFSDPDPLNSYVDFADYKATIDKDRITLKHATSFDDSGQPLAYFYDDGRNPITAGHDYAASKYGVRINNASDYNPRKFPGHLHYSMPKAVPLTDPNVEVFKSGPFGITIKMNKSKLIRKYGKQK